MTINHLLKHWDDCLGCFLLWVAGHFFQDGALILPGWGLIVLFGLIVLYQSGRLFFKARGTHDSAAVKASIYSVVCLILYVGSVTALSFPSISKLFNSL